MTKTIDPREILDDSPMALLQVLVVAITIGLNALDGFDILSISFAAPGIAKEWGIASAALGVVLSMELIGMALGSFFLGGVADRLGRRPTILGCLVLMALGMAMVTVAGSVVDLSVWRVVTGLGIGGMLAATNAVAAEFANKRRRHLCIALMVIGYPIGGILGGSVASALLAAYSWRAVFYFGAAITSVFVFVVYFMVPESVHWLARQQPAGALEKINQTFKRIGHSAISALPPASSEHRKTSIVGAFSYNLLATTVVITLAFSLHVMTFYFILKWVPKVVADMGFAQALAGGVLVWVNVGGALGGGLFGVLTLKYQLKKLTVLALVLAGIFVAVFGQSPGDLAYLSLFAAIAGFFCNAAVVGLYAIAAQVFPTHVRAFGTGVMIGFGRGGSALSPIVAGILLGAGISLPRVAIIMGLGSIISAAVLIFLKLEAPESTSKKQAVQDEYDAIEAPPLRPQA